jgi:hypothetical protein
MVKKKDRKINLGQVIIPLGHPNPPEPHEVDVAMILARHYQTTVEFLIPIDDYKRKTADIVMLGVQWEIKSPIGVSKSTIGNQFSVAKRQSRNIVIDTRRTALEYIKIEKKAIIEVKKRPNTKRVILIDKFEKVVEVSK